MIRISGGSVALAVVVAGWPSHSFSGEPEQLNVTLNLTGSIDDIKRLSGNYSQYIEDWSTHSEFTHSGELTLFRDSTGRVGSLPTALLAMFPHDSPMIFNPFPSPMDSLNHTISGQLKVSGCVNRTDALAKSSIAVPQLPAGVFLPPGVSRPVLSPELGVFFIQSCKANDRLLVFYSPPPGLYDVPASGKLRCTDTNTYNRPKSTEAQYAAHMFEKKFVADLNAACPGHPRKASKYMAFMGSVAWDELTRGAPVVLTRNDHESKGSRESHAPFYDQTLKLSLTLQVGDDIHAIPGGPYSVTRGESVTLDGSKSRPSKGHKINNYRWTLTPAGCQGVGKPVQTTGPTVTFKALCDVKAELIVSDDGGKTSKPRSADVAAKARAWKSVLTTDPPFVKKDLGFSPPVFKFGGNRCKTHPDADPDHYFHRVGSNPLDYENGTFWLDEVKDEGPFSGVWYVSKGDFTIPRIKIVNRKFYPGGAIHDYSPPDGGDQKALIDRLRRSVEFHETQHSTLVEKALGAMEDPAKRVELGMSGGHDDLKEQMNAIMIAAYSQLAEASSEENVHSEMRRVPDFVPGGTIYYPASMNEPSGSRTYGSFVEIGD